MTNYNDGKWHGWNGGECPVHPDTVVEGIYIDPETNTIASLRPAEDKASYFDWIRKKDYILIAFRVIKEYKEPREFWIQGGKVYEDVPPTCHNSETIHVRELLE